MTGRPAPMPIPALSDRDLRRFWSKVGLPDVQGCMNWLARDTDTYGYGRISIGLGHRPPKYKAHRVAYALAYGDPGESVLDHLCRNHACCNPDHLEPVTHGENVRRGQGGWGAHHRAKAHCPVGHPYDDANTYVSPEGWRRCRACHRRWDRERRKEALAGHGGNA